MNRTESARCTIPFESARVRPLYSGVSRTKKSAEKIFAETFRKALEPKTVRQVRAKSEADVWFEQMKKDFVANGAEHIKAARTKMGEAE